MAATLFDIYVLQTKESASSESKKRTAASAAPSKSTDKRKYNQMDHLISSIAGMEPGINREKAPLLFDHEEQLQFESTTDRFHCTCAGGVAKLPGIISTIALLIKELTLLVSYVRNNAFPQPLSEQDESKYLGMMAEGDAKARDLLIERNLRLVAHIVKRFGRAGWEGTHHCGQYSRFVGNNGGRKSMIRNLTVDTLGISVNIDPDALIFLVRKKVIIIRELENFLMTLLVT